MSPAPSPADQVLRPMLRTIESIVDEEALRERLDAGEHLRIKYGVDLTAPNLHLGHAVNLWLMRHLQENGHTVVFLLGDTTTQVGDPTGRSATRPVLGEEEIARNAEAFLAQISRVLRTEPELLEVRRNSEWYGEMAVPQLLSLFAMTTHAQLMARDMFRARIAEGREIALHELTYPVLQGYDSAALRSDLTIVGSDQLFNEMMGRHYQQRLGQRPQSIITTVITPGLDGGAKQSKSLRNYVALEDPPGEKLGKVMSLADPLVGTWASAYTDLPDARVAQLEADAAAGGLRARDAKLALAEAVVARYDGAEAARRAREEFLAVFSQRGTPEDIPDAVLDLATGPHPRTLTALELLDRIRPELSRSARRRLLLQGAVQVDGVPVRDPEATLEIRDGMLVRTGPRRWVRVREG
ncbi:tyrosine--tRNA ligase [Brachybacterium hainanense]|uniref:Tyrosine--tRNA ligase n=1 Tax=Brachybacterium hainanense TaxID=1541174 RepID=A0ABV6RGB1_9MICO